MTGPASSASNEPDIAFDAIVELVESLDPNPAYVIGARWDVLHANPAARTLFADWPSRPRIERNMLWYYLCDPSARTLFLDWEAEAAHQLAHFRYAAPADDPAVAALVERVIEHTPIAGTWWEQLPADPNRSGRKRMRMADGGVVGFRQLVLQHLDTPDLQVVCYLPDTDDTGDDDEGFEGFDDVEDLID